MRFPKVKYLLGDRDNPKDLERVSKLGPWDVVVDTICEGKNRAELLCQHFTNTRKIITISASAVHFIENNNLSLENEKLIAYAKQKWDAERTIEAQITCPYAIIRPHRMTGPGDPSGKLSWYASKIFHGERIAFSEDHNPLLQWTDVRDVAQAIIKIVKKKDLERIIFNVAKNEAIQLRQVLELLGGVLEKKTSWVTRCLLPK